MKLVIVHNHFRPGGVRRVIELATAAIIARWRPRIEEVVLVAGEAPDATWLGRFRENAAGRRVRCAIEPALGYWSEQRSLRSAAIARRIDSHLAGVLAGADGNTAVVWAHNQGLGRNLLLSRALADACAARAVTLVFHHHDWWFDNRWGRWPEMRAAGFRTLESVAGAMLPVGPHVRHATINRHDAGILERHLRTRAAWVPNLADPQPRVPAADADKARRWLARELGDDAPVWLMPCRLLRRKNVAEALLLTRWLRPDAWLVTTGGVSSAEEQSYANALRAASRRHGWRLRLSVLAGDESAKPRVPALIAASEALLLTSLQEGFGLPYIEAAAAGRPLIARTLPNIAPDLARFGFTFPQSYDELCVASGLFDARRELQRQAKRWRAWLRQLPARYRRLAAQPEWLETGTWPEAVPFSRLTLPAQLEVLAHPADEMQARCAPLNPWLAGWARQAAKGRLAASPWPRASERWLGGAAYVARLLELIRARPPTRTAAHASIRVMNEFVRVKLAADNQYPLLWSPEP